MKSSAIVCAVAAVLSLGSVSSFAQGRVYDRNASNNPEIYQQTHPEDQSGRNLQGRRFGNQDNRDFNRRDDNNRRDDYNRRGYDNRRGFDRGTNYSGANRYYGEGSSPYYYGARSPEFRRGGYIPYEYRNRSYYVNDWRGHHLAAPPRGHQWVQVGSDYVLIALATGLIANLVLNQ
jgi:Ni/Co efflux regulator RcnB